MGIIMRKEIIYKMFSHIPALYTDRLVLRKMQVIDSSDMFEYAKLDSVTRYLTWFSHKNEDYTKDYLKYISTRYNTGDFYDWAVIYKQSNKMIGTCGFTKFDLHSNKAEIGYVLNPLFWGQGVAVEAAKAVMSFGFENLNLHRIEAKFIQGNSASLSVMKKLGMKFEGYARDEQFIKGQYKTIGTCAVLSDEFKKQNVDSAINAV